MYEPLIRVPLIVKYPGQQQAGSVCNALVNSTDCAPTLLQSAGCAVPRHMAGSDLLDLPEREFTFAESGSGHSYMVRSQRYKLLWCRDDVQSQLFDLEEDPYELHNLYADSGHGQIVVHMKSALAQWALFNAPSTVHLDEDAPIVRAANARTHDAGHRQDMHAYFAQQMQVRLEN